MPSESTGDRSGCPKCGHTEVTTDSMSATGSGLTKMFDIQTKNFKLVTCSNCGYTEMYRDVGKSGMDIVDVFFG